jgi:hypothetical protein
MYHISFSERPLIEAHQEDAKSTGKTISKKAVSNGHSHIFLEIIKVSQY